MVARELNFYQCRNCKQTAVAPVRYLYREICCIGCASYLRWMWSEPITTPEQTALANRGLVFNPGTSAERDLLPKASTECLPNDGEGRR